jgi:hypothetical protein
VFLLGQVCLDLRDQSRELGVVGVKIATSTQLAVVDLVVDRVDDLEGTGGVLSWFSSNLNSLALALQGGFHLPEAGPVPSSTTVSDVDVDGGGYQLAAKHCFWLSKPKKKRT